MERRSFPRSARLLSAGDYKPVFNRADFKASSRNALVLARRNTQGNCRLGLVIAKKHVRHAVQRNRIKRLVREHFRNTPHSAALDIVFLARAGLAEMDNAALHRLISDLWQKLDLELSRAQQ
jgi:ribonuclease P protein component